MNNDEPVLLESPGGVTSLAFTLRDGRPLYRIDHGDRRVLDWSPLGLDLADGGLTDGFSLAGTTRETVDETWEPVWGRYDEVRDHYREMVVDLERAGDGPAHLSLRFRAFDDGVGFRYELPEWDGGDDAFAITAERTGFDLATDATAWWIPGDYDSYEYLYERTDASAVPRAHTPITFELADDCYASIHEAALRDYAAMTVSGPAADGEPDRPSAAGGVPLTATLTPLPDGTKVRAERPHRSPWRTVQLGSDPADLVESSLLVSLDESPEGTYDWVAPDTYVGVWWEMHIGESTWAPGPDLGATTENAKRYVDFAADHGIPYVLVEGWNDGWVGSWDDQDFTTPNPRYVPEAVAAHAAERGVALIGHCETGGMFRDFEAQLDDAFDLFERLGCAAVKTGYVTDLEEQEGMPGGHHHHDQRLVEHHRRVAEAAAERGLMLDVHEGVKPTGMRRSRPNHVTSECVRGMEYNAWSDGNPPRHTVVLPFTRMLAGPLDYTPGIFDLRFQSTETDDQPDKAFEGVPRVHTTRARQLALLVILFSGLQMAADLPEHYVDAPEFAVVEAVPADWDDTRITNAAIGESITVARRHGDEWFVGSATDGEPRDVEIPLSFLGEGSYEARIYRDADDCDVDDNPVAVTVDRRTVTAGDTLVARMVGGGGHAVHLVPE